MGKRFKNPRFHKGGGERHGESENTVPRHPQLDGADILFLEDDVIISLSTSDALEEMGCGVRAVLHLEAAWDSAQRQLPDAAVLDVNLSHGTTSLEFAEWLDEQGVPVIFLTGYDTPPAGGGWSNYPRVLKPVDFAELARLLNAALKNKKR